MSYKFIKTADPDNRFDNTNVTVEVVDSASSVSDMLEAFAEFLRGCGYHIDGVLEIYKEEESKLDDNAMDYYNISSDNTDDIFNFEEQEKPKPKRKRKKSN